MRLDTLHPTEATAVGPHHGEALTAHEPVLPHGATAAKAEMCIDFEP
jgi:hypothetical protein